MPRQSSISPSRAGDVFHYRWAARRCLRLLDPQFGLEHITVECSQRPDLPGELVIDVAEYSTAEGKGTSRVEHFQLKHGTVNPEAALTLSDLKKTLAGFAARFRAHRAEGEVPDMKKPGIFFTVVTNRPICSKLKDGVGQIARDERMAADRFARDFQKASGLEHAQLPDFCRRLSFLDKEGNYAEQKQRLRQEMASFVPGSAEQTGNHDGDVAAIKALLGRNRNSGAKTSDAKCIEQIERRIAELVAFREIAHRVEAHLRAQSRELQGRDGKIRTGGAEAGRTVSSSRSRRPGRRKRSAT